MTDAGGETSSGHELLRGYVANAIRSRAQGGDAGPYMYIVGQVGDRQLSGDKLQRWLLALTDCASLITESEIDLVNALLSFDWFGRKEQKGVIEAFVRLLLSLMTTNTAFCRPVFSNVVGHFAPVHTLESAASTTLAAVHGIAGDCGEDAGEQLVSDSPADQPADLTQEYVRVMLHALLRDSLRLIPTASSILFPVIAKSTPHRRIHRDIHYQYVKNVFRVVEYAPELLEKIVMLVIDKITMIDVEIRLEDAEDEDERRRDEDTEAAAGAHAAAGGNEAAAAAAAGSVPDAAAAAGIVQPPTAAEAEAEANAARAEERLLGGTILTATLTAAPSAEEEADEAIDVMADKLDALMELFLDFADVVKTNTKFRDMFFRAVLRGFERSILTTHRSKYVQFLVFYMCSSQPSYSSAFLNLLHRRMADVSTEQSLAISCSSYIASFTARAAFLPSDVTVDAMDMLNRWAIQYADAHERKAAALDLHGMLARHGLFYAVCQGLFYTFCFKHRELLTNDRGRMFVYNGFKAARLIESPLNPVRFALKSVTREFAASLTAIEHPALAALATVVRGNRRIMVRSSSASSVLPPSGVAQSPAGGASHGVQIDTVFPFDPYLLRRSADRLASIYQQWEPLAPQVDLLDASPTRRGRTPSMDETSPGIKSAPQRRRLLSTALSSSDEDEDEDEDAGNDSSLTLDSTLDSSIDSRASSSLNSSMDDSGSDASDSSSSSVVEEAGGQTRAERHRAWIQAKSRYERAAQEEAAAKRRASRRRSTARRRMTLEGDEVAEGSSDYYSSDEDDAAMPSPSAHSTGSRSSSSSRSRSVLDSDNSDDSYDSDDSVARARRAARLAEACVDDFVDEEVHSFTLNIRPTTTS